MPSLDAWESFLDSQPDAHFLQTAAWGRVKSGAGWQADSVIAGGCGALVLYRPLPLGFTVAYLPRGPVPATAESLRIILPALDALCRKRRAALLKIEPDFAGDAGLESDLAAIGFRPSPHTIQPPRTILVDLRGSDEEILNRMKPKTRYNIRLAMRHDVKVAASDNLAEFARLVHITADRDDFGTHPDTYYQSVYANFASKGMVSLFLAEYKGQPIAGVFAIALGKRAWYVYGASSDEHREVMATYLLQWEAMRWARSRGCSEYDLWGIPDEDEPELERQFASRQDGLWGVYRAKRGYGGRVWRTVGAWDRVYNLPLYLAYQIWAGRRRPDAA